MKRLQIAMESTKLANGLNVVVAPDTTAPVVTVGVYYKIGFRLEPQGRSGFAHLFEHMMFQGSANAPKMQHIKLVNSSGGMLNGSTSYDVTNYYEAVPSNALERVLWLEADRMRALKVDDENLKNQRDVVKEEVRVNVMNQPYGGFPWLDMPQYANTNWYNAHNFYGELKDIEAATLPEVQSFFKTYYAPNNAALAIVGDFDPVQARQMVEKYFGGIKQAQLPAVPELAEPQQEKEKHAKKVDALAQRPAIAIAYHMPERNTPEYYAMGLIDQILIEGDDSLEYQELVQKKGLTAEVEGGINYLGNMFNYKGPMLFMADFKTDPGTSPDTAIKAWDDPIEALRAKPVSKETLDRARVKLRSNLYDSMGQIGGFGLADLLASFALFDDNPARINTLVSEFEKVTPQLIQKTAQEYLRPENRTVLVLQTKPAEPAKN